MKKYKNILVHALINLGDVVLSTSAIALLKKIYPEARITMLVRPEVADVAYHNPVIDDIIVFNYRSKHSSLGCMLTVLREIKSRRFDLAISFDQKLRPALLCWLARIPTRVCSDINFDGNPSRIAWFYNKVVHIGREFLHNNPQAETFQEIVRQLLDDNRHEVPVIPAPTAQSQETARGLLSVFPQNTKKIALCVKGTFPLKTWPKESFADLVHRLSHKYRASFFVIGAPNDSAYADEVIAAIGNIGGGSTKLLRENIYQRTDRSVWPDRFIRFRRYRFRAYCLNHRDSHGHNDWLRQPKALASIKQKCPAYCCRYSLSPLLCTPRRLSNLAKAGVPATHYSRHCLQKLLRTPRRKLSVKESSQRKLT